MPRKKVIEQDIRLTEQDTNAYQLRLYGKEDCHYCHRIRFTLKVKNLNIGMVFIEDIKELPQEIIENNPMADISMLPILVERDFAITRPDIISQYIDERFPAPPLMPLTPQERARMRSYIHHIESNVVLLADEILNHKGKKPAALTSKFKDALISLSYEYCETIDYQEHAINMIDCMLAPLIWRLAALGIKLSDNRVKYQHLISYWNFIMSQGIFIKSCTDKELTLHAD